jgi:hypothetical protein
MLLAEAPAEGSESSQSKSMQRFEEPLMPAFLAAFLGSRTSTCTFPNHRSGHHHDEAREPTRGTGNTGSSRACGHLTGTACFCQFRAVLRCFFFEIHGIAAQKTPGSAQNQSNTRSFTPNVNTPQGEYVLMVNIRKPIHNCVYSDASFNKPWNTP